MDHAPDERSFEGRTEKAPALSPSLTLHSPEVYDSSKLDCMLFFFTQTTMASRSHCVHASHKHALHTRCRYSSHFALDSGPSELLHRR